MDDHGPGEAEMIDAILAWCYLGILYIAWRPEPKNVFDWILCILLGGPVGLGMIATVVVARFRFASGDS